MSRDVPADVGTLFVKASVLSKAKVKLKSRYTA